MKSFHLVISSPSEKHFDGEAAAITLPGSDGELTILPHHEPFVTTLKAGAISVRDAAGEKQVFENEGGIVECSANNVIVLL